MKPMIEVCQLRKEFGNFTAVDNISFTLEPGNVLGFLGPNGAGKSTTMKMITGFLPITSGRISVCGIDVQQKPVDAKGRIGYLPEGAPLYAEMTPATFLNFIGDIRGLDAATKKRRIEAVVDQVQLQAVWHQPIETLSKGYKRRVGLAQAILHDPEVLILDEPTDGLDPNQKFEVRQLVTQMAENKAIIISTHILEEVDAVCNRALIIGHGKALADGTPSDLLALSAYSGAYTLKVETAQGAAIKAALNERAEVDHVSEKNVDAGTIALTAFPASGASLDRLISDMVRSNGWNALEIRRESGRLDDVFRQLTRGRHTEGEGA